MKKYVWKLAAFLAASNASNIENLAKFTILGFTIQLTMAETAAIKIELTDPIK